jgi:hypothetical protein
VDKRTIRKQIVVVSGCCDQRIEPSDKPRALVGGYAFPRCRSDGQDAGHDADEHERQYGIASRS